MQLIPRGFAAPIHLKAILQRLACTAILAACAFEVIAAAAPAIPAPAASAPQKIAEIEGITEYRLANGLRVLLFPDQSKPTITVNMTYLVGSRHESYGESGMAHLLEHLLFKGTPKHPDIPKEFNQRGARFNGTTSLDRTNYYELFDASDDNLDWALGLEADRMIHSFVAQKDLDTEMTVVRNEFERGENSPTGVLIKRLQSIAYDWHNYGNSTIGNRSDIENVEIDNLQAFYRRYYQPDNAVLLVAGKFESARALQLIGKHFDPIPRPTRVLPKLWTTEPVQDGERSFVVRRVGDLQVVIAAYKAPAEMHADAVALGFAQSALTDTPSGRLHKALVETGKAAQVASLTLGGRDSSLVGFAAIVKKGEPIDAVQAELLRQVEELHANPPTAEEVERARVNLANSAERVMNDHENIGLALSEYVALGDWRLFFLLRDQAQKVTTEAVQQAAARYLRRDNRTVGVFLHDENPQRAEIPAVASAEELLEDYQPQVVAFEAEEFDPSPENIERRVRRLDVAGMKIALLRKKNRGESVFFTMNLPGGDEQSLNGQTYAGLLAGSMLATGTSRYTREQLRDEFAKLKVSGGVSGQGASFQTTGPNIAAAIRLAAHVLQEPSFPADEFAQLKQLMVTSIESQMSDPGVRASEALSRHFNIYPKGDPRYAATLQEQLEGVKAVTLEDVKRFHRQFYAANRAQFAVVGDFAEADVIKAIEEGFGAWRNDTPWKRITREFRAIPARQIVIETPDKENAVLLARLNVDTNQNDPDYAALYLADVMLGGSGMDSRLMSRIRVKEGLSYGVSSSVGGSIFDRAGGWNIQATAAPQNIARVEAAFREELDRALQTGFTAEEIAKAKSGWQQRFAQFRVQDQSLASRLLSHLDSGRTFLTWDKEFEASMMAVTPETARAALRKHLDPARLTIVRAGDFAKTASPQ